MTDPDPAHRSTPPTGKAPPEGGLGLSTPTSGITPAPSPVPVTPAKPKASEIAPPKVKSEEEQVRALDYVEAAIAKSAEDSPEAQKQSLRLRALYRLMVTGVGAGESWGNRLSPVSAARLIFFCMANGLDPSGSDVFILGERPYLAFEGRLKIAYRSAQFDGYEVDRPCTPEERTLYGQPTDGVAWLSVARRKDCRFGFLGIGHASGSDRNPVAKQFPLDMAQKRARANALALAFPAEILTPAGEVADRTIDVTVNPDAPPPAPVAPPASGPTAAAPAEAPASAEQPNGGTVAS